MIITFCIPQKARRRIKRRAGAKIPGFCTQALIVVLLVSSFTASVFQRLDTVRVVFSTEILSDYCLAYVQTDGSNGPDYDGFFTAKTSSLLSHLHEFSSKFNSLHGIFVYTGPEHCLLCTVLIRRTRSDQDSR